MSEISRRFAFLLAAALPVAGCATGTQAPTVGPEDIPVLEAALEGTPESADTLTLLGIAYYEAARHDDAIRVLERAVSLDDVEPIAHLHLGLAHEAGEHWQGASDAYAAFLAVAPEDSDVRSEIEQRVALVERHLMEAELRTMLEQEDVLSRQAAAPRSVAVFPFRVVADDPRYQPLEAALADMVTTDLGIPGTLQLLERAQIQAMVREMALTLAGYTDPGSGARVGRLMRAEHVVQGSVVLLGDDRLRLEMAVVDPATADRRGEAADETALAQIFDAEKQLVLEVLGLLGVTLTDAEREAIEENRTSSLLALLSYGEGLGAMDRGDFSAASSAFQEAARLDPGFQAAQTRSQEASSLQQAAQTSGSQIAAAAQSEQLAVPVVASNLAEQLVADINRSGSDELGGNGDPGRDVQNNPTREDRQTTGTTVRIILDNPNLP